MAQIKSVQTLQIVGNDGSTANVSIDELPSIITELSTMARASGSNLTVLKTGRKTRVPKDSTKSSKPAKAYGISEKKQEEVFNAVMKVSDVDTAKSRNKLLMEAQKEHGLKFAPNQSKAIGEYLDSRKDALIKIADGARTFYKRNPKFNMKTLTRKTKETMEAPELEKKSEPVANQTAAPPAAAAGASAAA